MPAPRLGDSPQAACIKEALPSCSAHVLHGWSTPQTAALEHRRWRTGRFRHLAAPCARAALQGGEALADAVKSQESREEGCSQRGRHQAGNQQAPLVVRGYPRWRCQAWGLEPGEDSGRHCLLVLSAEMGLAAPPAHFTTHMPSPSLRNPISSGDPLHICLPQCPAQGQGAVLVPPLPSPTVRLGRPGSAVQPKGRAGALPITAHAGNLSL